MSVFASLFGWGSASAVVDSECHVLDPMDACKDCANCGKTMSALFGQAKFHCNVRWRRAIHAVCALFLLLSSNSYLHFVIHPAIEFENACWCV